MTLAVQANVESDVAASFDTLGYGVTSTGTNLQALIKQHGVVIKVNQVGGLLSKSQGKYRCVIEVYAATYDKAWGTASAITSRFVAGHSWASGVLIDADYCESSFAERPYAEGTRCLNSTWVLTVRHATRKARLTP